MSETKHTGESWKIMADPVNAGRHPLHDNRYIVTSDADVEWNDRGGRIWRWVEILEGDFDYKPLAGERKAE